MARKIHLRANKLTETNVAFARCAARNVGDGKVRRNNRDTYRFMASEIVDIKEFEAVNAADRCSHCMDIGLQTKNYYRKQKGQPLATSLFDKLPK